MIVVNETNPINTVVTPVHSSPESPVDSPPDSEMTHSLSFALLNSLDGQLIDNLLDEVDEDDQKQAQLAGLVGLKKAAAVGPATLHKKQSMSRSMSRSASMSQRKVATAIVRTPHRTQSIQSISKKKNSNKRLHTFKESTLDFDVMSINGDLIDTILDEVDDKERLIVAHNAMQKGPADLNALSEATTVADDAIASMTAMLSFFQSAAGPTSQK